MNSVISVRTKCQKIDNYSPLGIQRRINTKSTLIQCHDVESMWFSVYSILCAAEGSI